MQLKIFCQKINRNNADLEEQFSKIGVSEAEDLLYLSLENRQILAKLLNLSRKEKANYYKAITELGQYSYRIAK